MLKNRSVKCLFILIVLSLIIFQSNIAAQDKKCLFISDYGWPGATLDLDLIAYLEKTYTVEIITDKDLDAGKVTIEEVKTYDFGFISETCDSKILDPLKGAPIPLFYTEPGAGKTYVTGWCPYPGTFWGGVENGTIKIVDETGHPLSAGYAKDEEIEIVTGSNEGSWLGYCNPGVEIIPIAVLASDPTKYNLFGVEAGTALYPNATDVIDPSLVSESRCVAFGISSQAFGNMTDDAWKFIDAGISWLLGEDVAVDEIDAEKPEFFKLGQNYPNPFNPSTKITFSLKTKGHTTLTVYNAMGQLITTLADQDMNVGTYHVTFDAKDLTSGIYLYQIRSGEFTQVKKMMLMK